jgi:hypothetical protein
MRRDMKITSLDKADYLQMVYENKDVFLKRIHAPEAFIVREFYDPREILSLRKRIFDSAELSEPSWHPLLDDCPDYHRLHDNYANAYVKSKMHSFYFHGWHKENEKLFSFFREIFDMKNFLAGFERDAFITNIPSNGQVARVNFQNYPVGGGHLAEHVDPISKFALVQTLIQASAWGGDFTSGGLYAKGQEGGDKLYLDPLTSPGDLVVLSPAIPHGVEAIDPQEHYEWKANRGKWTILPIIVNSDYPRPDNIKPRQLVAS